MTEEKIHKFAIIFYIIVVIIVSTTLALLGYPKVIIIKLLIPLFATSFMLFYSITVVIATIKGTNNEVTWLKLRVISSIIVSGYLIYLCIGSFNKLVLRYM